MLVVLEVAIRWARPELDVPHLRVHAGGYYTWYPHARFTYRNLPDVEPRSAPVRVNGFGLRGDELPAVKPPGERRVLALGDSYTAAVQLPEDAIFATLLERALNQARPAVRHRVLNAGVNGAGTSHEVLFYEHESAALAPDVVILQYAWNDLGDTRAHDAFRVTGGGVELRPELRDPPFWREPLLALRDAVGNRSLAAYLLYRAVAQLGTRNAVAADDVGVTLVARLAARLVAEANARGIPVVILTIPAPIGLAGGDAEYDAVVAAFARLVAGSTNQLIVTDTLLRDVASRGGEPYLAHDGHLAPAGHRAVADALAAALLRYERAD